MFFEKIAPYTYRIPRQGKMRVDAVFFASKEILKDLEAENYASLQQLMNVATLPGIVEPALAMPDIHWGYGFPIGGVAAFDPEEGGVVSPGGVGFDINCGVRLLASHLTLEDLLPRQKELADALYRLVPSGVGSERRDVRFSKRELKEILKEGAGWLVKRGYGYPEDVRFIESQGRLPWANPDKVSERAFERGAPQIGTLGSGNHFLEVQYVDEVYDEEAALAFGLFKGQVTVLIHTGSRGLGHQVCQDYVERFLKVAPRYGIELVDKQLAAAPIKSPEGQDYLQAMAAAEPGTDRTDITTVLLEDQEIVLRVVGHEVDAARLILGERVRVDDRCDRRIGLGPTQIEGVTSRPVTENGGLVLGEERRDEKQGEETHEGMAAEYPRGRFRQARQAFL